MNNHNVEVIQIRFPPPGKALKAFADILINGWIIREFRIIKEDAKRPWIASPQISWKDQDGQIKYKTVITLPDEVKGQIDFAILKAYTEEMEKNSEKQKR